MNEFVRSKLKKKEIRYIVSIFIHDKPHMIRFYEDIESINDYLQRWWGLEQHERVTVENFEEEIYFVFEKTINSIPQGVTIFIGCINGK